MYKPNAKCYIFLFTLFAIVSNSIAKNVPGYIVLEGNDTVFGEVKLHNFSRTTAGFMINGFDMEWCHQEVTFRDSNSRKFTSYLPKDIFGYGFTYESADYIFHSSILNKKSLIKEDSKRQQFLHLIYAGKISLYVDLRYSSLITGVEPYTYYEYYLYSPSVGLVKAEFTKEIKTIHDLLRLFNVEIEFLYYISFTTPLKEIKVVLMQYNDWLNER